MSKRFIYEKLTDQQLRIGVALLGVEKDITDALEAAAEAKVTEALATFGVVESRPIGLADVPTRVAARGARGGARGKGSKSSRRAAKPSAPAAVTDSAKTESRQLQGKYIAAIRRVPKTKRAAYKAGEGVDRSAAIARIDRDYPKKA